MTAAALATVESIGRPSGIEQWRYIQRIGKSDLPPITREVLRTLAGHAHWKTCVIAAEHTPTQPQLAAEMGRSLRTVGRALTDARERGWLHVIPGQGNGRKSTYMLQIPGGPEPVDNHSEAAPTPPVPNPLKVVTATAFKPPESSHGDHTPTYIERDAEKDHHRRTDRTPGGGVDKMTMMIISEIERATGRTLTLDQARHVSWTVLGRREGGPPSAPVAYVRQAVRNDPGSFLPAVTPVPYAQVASRPECDHGVPGGSEPHPATGLPACPLCRTARTSTTPEGS